MKRAQRILVAGYLAVGFIALRLIYAFVFSGLGGNQLILSLPSVRLSGPFAHITLLGDVSVDGIIRNLELAMPFAISILVFGIVASFITPSLLEKWALKATPIGNLLRSVGIGLSSLPGLFDASKKVLAAQKLRRESRSRMLVPILERALEMANSIGLRLALRPTGSFRSNQLSISSLHLQDADLGPIDLEVGRGEIVVISGPTGSGKSTLLEAIAGILTEYRGRKLAGEVIFSGKKSLSISEIANFVGFIPQNPKELLWEADIHEVLKTLKPALLKQLGLQNLQAKTSEELSEGEALKLLLAKALLGSPSILLLDEPFAPLDQPSRLALTQLLNALSAKGVAVVVVEHEPDHTAGLDARQLQLASGKLVSGRHTPEKPAIERVGVLVGSEPVLSTQLDDIGFDRLLINSPRVLIRQAERVWLAGENGSGKSTLLRALTASSDNENLVLVPENFDDFFVTESLEKELLRADAVAKVPAGFTKTTLESILPIKDLASWAHIHPRDLSRGTRLALAIAMQLSHKPQILLIDEPFRGLDTRARELMVHSLRCVSETGCAVLFASHEKTWSEALRSRKLEIRDQNLIEIVEVSA